MDKVTIQRLALLHPSVVAEAMQIVEECCEVLTGRAEIRITYGLRTNKEQAALYALGRTVVNPQGKTAKKPMGNIVTNAKAGQSVHNYGFAVDMCLIIDGKVASWDTKKDWDGDKVSDWDECVKVFAKHGWTWGGNWRNFKDMPHFEKIGFNNWRALSKMKVDAKGYVIL